MTNNNEDRGVNPSNRDYAAAERVLVQRPGSPAPAPETSEYLVERERLAISHSVHGPDRFALRNHLREPRTSAERIERASIDEGWPQEEFIRRLRAHIERPVDSLMIEEVSEARVRSLVDLGRFLRTVIDCATKGWPPGRVLRAERIAGRLIDRLGRRRLYKEELLTACNYFEGVRNSLEPVRCGTFSGASAHEVCIRVTNQVVELWRRFGEIAARSRQPGPYTHATSASELFYRQIERDAIPRPNELLALLELERRHAMRALARVAEQDRASAPDRTIRAGLVHIEAEQLHVTTTKVPAEIARQPGSGMSVDEARVNGERIVKEADGAFPGRNKLAKLVGCSRATMSEAIDASTYLTARRAEHHDRESTGRARRVSTVDPRHLDQCTEVRPGAASSALTDAEEMARLISEQESEMRRDERQRQAAKRSPRHGIRSE